MPRINGKLALVAITAFIVVPLVLAHGVHPKVSEKGDAFGHIVKPVSHDSFQQWAFAKLFPFNARWNSVLATFYISSFPNFILALVPTELDPTQLNTMIAFATGGLLGDVCMHLIPHSFMGEAVETGLFVDGIAIKHVVVEEKRNIIIGAAIFGGFFAFYFLDKTMRVLNASDEGGAGGHSHAHHHHHHAPTEAVSSAVETKSTSSEGIRQRKEKSEDVVPAIEQVKGKEVSASLRLSAYLNLFGDFTHNITDGLAMAASFYASPQLGAISTFATFCHEIPHEIADYSILIKSGFTKRQAMTSQFITAIGAFVGTFLGIWIAESAGAGASSTAGKIGHGTAGFFGTSVRGADIVIPATAGGFLYIASVSVIPELLAESRSVKQTLKEYAFMMFGFGVMGLLAWNE